MQLPTIQEAPSSPEQRHDHQATSASSHAPTVKFMLLPSEPQKPINETRRFALLVLGCFGSICCSFAYTFDLVAKPMQEKYNLTQREMSTVSTVGIIVLYFALPYAFVYDYLGPMPLCFLAVGTYTIGSLLLIQCLNDGIGVSVGSLSVFCALMNTGSTLFSLTSLMTVLSYFPAHKGVATAIIKSFVGLGSAIAGCVYLGFFSDRPSTFVYFLLIISLIVGLISVVFLHLPSYHVTGYERQCIFIEEDVEDREARIAQYLRQKLPMGRVVYGFAIVLFLIVFLPGQTALVAFLDLDSHYRHTFAIVVCIATVLTCGMILPWEKLDCGRMVSRLYCCCCKDTKEDDHSHNHRRHHRNSLSTSSNTMNNSHSLKSNIIVTADAQDVSSSLFSYPTLGHGVLTRDPVPPGPIASASTRGGATQGGDVVATEVLESELDYLAPQYQTPFMHNIRTADLWALWWTLFCFGGVESVVMYNATYIYAALDGKMPDEAHRALLTVLNGVGSAFGRLVLSYFEVWSQKRRAEDRIPITISFFFPSTFIIITLTLFVTLPGNALWLAYLFSGITGGCIAAAVPVVTRTMYAKDNAKHYCFTMSSYVVAAIALNMFLYGEWTYRQAQKQGMDVCYGRECVLMPMLVMLALCCSTFLTSGLIHWRYRRYCQLVLADLAQNVVRQNN